MSEPSPDGSPYQGSPNDPPDGIDPAGVPTADAGRNTFILTVAVTVALLALIFTLGWIVYHQLASG